MPMILTIYPRIELRLLNKVIDVSGYRTWMEHSSPIHSELTNLQQYISPLYFPFEIIYFYHLIQTLLDSHLKFLRTLILFYFAVFSSSCSITSPFPFPFLLSLTIVEGITRGKYREDIKMCSLPLNFLPFSFPPIISAAVLCSGGRLSAVIEAVASLLNHCFVFSQPPWSIPSVFIFFCPWAECWWLFCPGSFCKGVREVGD